MNSQLGHGRLIRPLVPDDLPELARLKAVQGDLAGVWRSRFDWQFTANPAYDAARPIGWVVDLGGGRLAAHQMAMPQRLRVAGKEQFCAFSCDTYCDAALRGQGVGRALFTTYFEAQRGGIAITTSANTASEALWLKAGAAGIPNYNQYFFMPLRPAALVGELARRAGLPVGRAVGQLGRELGLDAAPRRLLAAWLRIKARHSTIEWVSPDAPQVESIWISCQDEYAITAVRDLRYRVWRFAQCPPPRPRLAVVTLPASRRAAFFAVRFSPSTGGSLSVAEVIDVFGPRCDPALQRAVFSHAALAALGEGSDVIRVRGLHPAWRASLACSGWLRARFPSNPFLFRDMGGAARELLSSAESWHLCGADGDATVG